MRGILFLFITSLVLDACENSSKTDIAKEKDDMKKADIAFSDLSAQKGMKAAFLQYLDSAVVLLRPDHYPIVGKDAQEYLQKVNDSTFTLTWKPDAAEVASSGDLGFTYGIYTLKQKDTVMQGTYVSVWKKQADGSWKYILDTGNPGVGKPK